ncbi:16S rRNA (uracil(1498)-N(3))-methyltransferase [Winogradskyella sp. A3E31]|uniref:16S rRNA (uracil(1498)-N(3))-methyltransferase n=1 Tax=Winogradskyella sp. A3E31 TaxID=3349637 RepID=UPI00398B2C49
MQLFFSPNISESDSTFHFNKDESRHIAKVLRKRTGDILYITNGKGWLFKAKLIAAEIKNCSIKLLSQELLPERDYQLHLAVAPTKMNDRYEWFLEKATEIGIDSITPIICEHSERKVIKPERFQRIIESALKQSNQCYLPELKPAMAFSEYLEGPFDGDNFIAHCEETDRKSLKSQLKKNSKTTILIGPEGDFSTSEIELALHTGFIPVTLGETRLRTETAAIVACHSVAFFNEGS